MRVRANVMCVCVGVCLCIHVWVLICLFCECVCVFLGVCVCVCVFTFVCGARVCVALRWHCGPQCIVIILFYFEQVLAQRHRPRWRFLRAC